MRPPSDQLEYSHFLAGLPFRSAGPHRGGRVVAVAGDPSHPMVFFFGSTGGGVWKTADGGLVWQNMSDGFLRRASVGAIALADADPNVLYVGMGECCIRGNVSSGDGIYKSTDAGRTWTHMGLPTSRHVSRVRIHPKDPNLVYVAAFGHAFGVNGDRGVFRSRNGGRSWERVLFRSERAGAIDLSMSPANPSILYAALWEARRYPWRMVSGGSESGLYKSTDGGDTWTELSRRPGLPEGILGRIGIAASPANQNRVWAIIEAEEGGVFRSDDGGENWKRVNDERKLLERAWYYSHIFADTRDTERVYVLNNIMWKSIDGGRTFSRVGTPHLDCHDLWIDPRDPFRMINGNDGGGCVSFNGGLTWSTIYNQPTGEFYHVTTDNRFPYRIYGAQQDNSTISIPSRSRSAAITQRDWYDVGGGESGYIAIRPDEPDIVYAGTYGGRLTRYDHRIGEHRNIPVWPDDPRGWGAKDHKYRFQWTFPILISPHNPNVLYAGGNRIFRTSNEGSSWEIISPDLSRNDPTKMEPSGGPITGENIGVEVYGTVSALAESPLVPGTLWAGSDDGLVHISRDAGKQWQNVTPPELPEWALISTIEPSLHDPATAYIAATRYKLDDFRPYLFRTNDFGTTWTRIVNGITDDNFTRVLREDPERPGLLFAGTETGLYVSIDDGNLWLWFQSNLPVVPVHDLVVKGGDLVLATHGRGFWVLDDYTPLRHVTPEILLSLVHLFEPRLVHRFRGRGHLFPEPTDIAGISEIVYPFPVFELPTGTTHYVNAPSESRAGFSFHDAGQNPPNGVLIYYYLKEEPESEITLSILNSASEVVRIFSSRGRKPEEDTSRTDPLVPANAGLNRFCWDMRYASSVGIRDVAFSSPNNPDPGPVVTPGSYLIRLRISGKTYGQSFVISPDPRISVSNHELEDQLALLIRIRDKVTEIHQATNQIRTIREQVNEWTRRVRGLEGAETVIEGAVRLEESLSAVEDELVSTRPRATAEDVRNAPPKLNRRLSMLGRCIAAGSYPPTTQSYEVFSYLSGLVDRQNARLEEILQSELGEFVALLRAVGAPEIAVRRGDFNTGTTTSSNYPSRRDAPAK
jgi:photosystem II stability/assembly factor-like uncharacterized protein